MQLARQTHFRDSGPIRVELVPQLAPTPTPTAALAYRVVECESCDQRTKKRGVSQSVPVSETLMKQGGAQV